MADIEQCLRKMQKIYQQDPVNAVRSQNFIQTLHAYVEDDLNEHLSNKAKRKKIRVVREAHLFGSYKAKDEDLAVVDPINGPLITVGVRSQMSSVAKNALTYYQDIIGECISLQERFPMTVMGYVYLHPYQELIADQKTPDHERWAKLYASISNRDDRLYKNQVGSYDQFAYMVVDFKDPHLKIRDDIVKSAVPKIDMQISTLVPRLVQTFINRNIWLADYFTNDEVETPENEVETPEN
ncbi:hypothetical protein BTHE_1374 [Bifidobacterium thermophilum]|nr:hypothetical protein BTHE_1374 [Bifidobacterium thermophilum]